MHRYFMDHSYFHVFSSFKKLHVSVSLLKNIHDLFLFSIVGNIYIIKMTDLTTILDSRLKNLTFVVAEQLNYFLTKLRLRDFKNH
jgi:hypothetical protein